MALLEERAAKVPSFMGVIRVMLSIGENRVEQIEEKPIEASEFFISDEEIQSFITATLVEDSDPLLV